VKGVAWGSNGAKTECHFQKRGGVTKKEVGGGEEKKKMSKRGGGKLTEKPRSATLQSRRNRDRKKKKKKRGGTQRKKVGEKIKGGGTQNFKKGEMNFAGLLQILTHGGKIEKGPKRTPKGRKKKVEFEKGLSFFRDVGEKEKLKIRRKRGG